MDSNAITTSDATDLSRRELSAPAEPRWLTSSWFGTLAIAVSLILIGMATIPLDPYLMSWIGPGNLPGELEVLLTRAEPFGHAYGVLFIIITLCIIARPRRREIGLLFGASIGAGLMADVIKVFIGRYRPSAVTPEEYGATFTGIRDLWSTGSMAELLDTAHHSFPSAHSATAFGFAVALAHLYPRGKAWFFVLASMVAMQRIAFGYHFPSDTMVGAAVGLLIGTLAVRIWIKPGDFAAAKLPEAAASQAGSSQHDRLAA